MSNCKTKMSIVTTRKTKRYNDCLVQTNFRLLTRLYQVHVTVYIKRIPYIPEEYVDDQGDEERHNGDATSNIRDYLQDVRVVQLLIWVDEQCKVGEMVTLARHESTHVSLSSGTTLV